MANYQGLLAALQQNYQAGGFKPSAFSGGPMKPLQPNVYSPYKFDQAGYQQQLSPSAKGFALDANPLNPFKQYTQPAFPMGGKQLPADGGSTPFTSYAQPGAGVGLSPNAQPSSLGGVGYSSYGGKTPGVGVPAPTTAYGVAGGATGLSQNVQASSLGGVGYETPITKVREDPPFPKQHFQPPGGLSSLQGPAPYQPPGMEQPGVGLMSLQQRMGRMGPRPRPY